MAQRRSTRSEGDEEESATRRRPARRRERPPADRDEPEAVEAEDADAVDDREPQSADSDEPEALDDREPDVADEPGDEPDRDDETTDADGREQDSREEDGREQDKRHARRGNGSALTAKQAARAALGQIMELTSKSAEGITEIGRTDDGWVVGIEVVEDRRIPSAADILASYQVTLDEEGELMSYRRVRRYMRGRGDSGEGS